MHNLLTNKKHWLVYFKMMCDYIKNSWKLVLHDFSFVIFLNILISICWIPLFFCTALFFCFELWWAWMLVTDDLVFTGLSSSLHSVHTGPCVPASKWHGFSGGTAMSACLSCGTNGEHLFFSHHRCLQDNEWNYTRAGQVFCMFKVRPGNQVD